MNFYEGRSSNNYEAYNEGAFSKELTKAFLWMFVGLILSGITAYTVATLFGAYLSKGMLIVLAVIELALVFLLSARLNKMSHTLAIVGFLSYAVLNGVTLSIVFLIYEIGSIVTAFMFSAVFFGVMAVYGLTTKKDLSRIGNVLFCGLISIIVISIVNIFLRSSGLNIALAYAGVAIFLGLTAFDIQKMKDLYRYNGDLVNSNMAIYAALTIYLDFINIFLRVLEILGKKNSEN